MLFTLFGIYSNYKPFFDTPLVETSEDVCSLIDLWKILQKDILSRIAQDKMLCFSFKIWNLYFFGEQKK